LKYQIWENLSRIEWLEDDFHPLFSADATTANGWDDVVLTASFKDVIDFYKKHREEFRENNNVEDILSNNYYQTFLDLRDYDFRICKFQTCYTGSSC